MSVIYFISLIPLCYKPDKLTIISLTLFGMTGVRFVISAARQLIVTWSLVWQRCECPSNPSLGNLPKTLIVGDGKKKAKRCHFDGREKYKLFPSFHCVPFGMTGSHSNKSAARMYLLLSDSLWQRWEGLFKFLSLWIWIQRTNSSHSGFLEFTNAAFLSCE